MSLANLAAYCFERGIPLLVNADKIEAGDRFLVRCSEAEREQVQALSGGLARMIDAKAGFLLSHLQTQDRKAADAAEIGG